MWCTANPLSNKGHEPCKPFSFTCFLTTKPCIVFVVNVPPQPSEPANQHFPPQNISLSRGRWGAKELELKTTFCKSGGVCVCSLPRSGVWLGCACTVTFRLSRDFSDKHVTPQTKKHGQRRFLPHKTGFSASMASAEQEMLHFNQWFLAILPINFRRIGSFPQKNINHLAQLFVMGI